MNGQDLRTEQRGDRSWFWRGLTVQANVVGALIMRELHTRYGRDNIGYLWMIGEPLLLAIAISLIHMGHKTHYGSDIRPIPFVIIGYCIFIIFRGIVGRSEGTLEANMPLLYHRMVTVFDMLLARSLLELCSLTLTLFIMLFLAVSLGLADMPARPLFLLTAIMLMGWLSFALSMIICAVTHERRTAARFIHPFIYMMFPLSGAFYLLEWLPEPYRTWMSWYPMTVIFETARYGQFEFAKDTYVDIPYVLGACLVLTYVGLVSIKLVRRHVHLR